MKPCVWNTLVGLAIATSLVRAAHADPVEDFYKTHPITIVTGYSAGGGFDLYARALAKHLRNHVPGNPNVLVQNMPGAGSLTATNYTYNVAPKDGTVITLARAPVMELLAGTASSAFDPLKITWIGNGATDLTVCALLGNPQINTFADAQKYPFTLAGLGPGSDDDMFTKVLDNMFDLKARLINGYPAGAEALLAVERGEVDGRCGWSWSTITMAKPEWVASKKMRVFTTLSLERSPRLPDTPAILEFAKTERQKQVLNLVIGSQVLGRPFFAPPGQPPERTQALRRAFDETMTDPAFIADRHNANEEVNPTDWRGVEALLQKLYATPKELVAETRAIIAGK